MPCESATVPAAVSPARKGFFVAAFLSHWSSDREGAAPGDKSEDLPCAIGCLLLRRKGVPEVVAGGFPVAANLFGQTFLRSDEEVVALLCRVVMPVFACAVFSVKFVRYGRDRTDGTIN